MLLRGQGVRTLLLTGHCDTVTIADYGDLVPLATDLERLAPALLARLRRKAAQEAEARGLDDLERSNGARNTWSPRDSVMRRCPSPQAKPISLALWRFAPNDYGLTDGTSVME